MSSDDTDGADDLPETVYRAQTGWTRAKTVHLTPDCFHLHGKEAKPTPRNVLGDVKVCKDCRGDVNRPADRSAGVAFRQMVEDLDPEDVGLSPKGERRSNDDVQ